MAIKNMTPEEIVAATIPGIDTSKLCGHCSDQNLYIQKIGTEEIYGVAVDLVPCKHEYIETDILIETETNNNLKE